LKILVCDDHALFREGVVNALRELEHGVVLLEAADGAEALRLAQAHPDLDIVLLDLDMPGTDGWTGLSRLQKACPTLPVVILSASEDPDDARRAIDAGAAGFVTKSTRGVLLRAALQLVLSGGVYVPPQLVSAGPPGSGPRRPGAAAASSTGRQRAAQLSPRQREVLRLMSRGLTNVEIGNVLGVALGTVKAHLAVIYEVLDVSNRTEAALVMRELGLDQDE
jgi:DNA-binding NarL/FixJ family response regulator